MSISIPENSDSNLIIENSTPSPMSPLEHQSRFLTLEEGEIFRKGAVVNIEDEEELSGGELRKELLDTTVARSPLRRLSFDEDELKPNVEES